VEAKPSLALLPFETVHPVGTVRSPTIRCNGEYSECHEQEEDHHVFFLSSWSDQEWFITAFIRTVVSLLRVYLMEGCSASVELHILTTHLHRGESGAREVIYTGEWVELPSCKKRSHTRGVVALPSLHWRRAPIHGTAPLEQVVLVRKAGGSGSRGDA
jgi:hypothetical protein